MHAPDVELSTWAVAMSPLDRDRLAKVLSRVSSSHDGEVVAAANAAMKFLKASGMSWNEVLEPQTLNDPDETIRAKLVVLKTSNDRLRRENNALRAKLKNKHNIEDGRPLEALSLWLLLSLLMVGFVIYVALS